MKYSRCLVLGGRGFLGSHVVEALLRRGTRVRVLDRPLPAGMRLHMPMINPSMLEVVEGDFTNRKDLEVAIEGCDSCIHLITTTLPKTSNDDMIFDIQTNLAGTIGFLNTAVRHGVKKIVYLSSGGTVYGNSSEDRITELHPTEPLSSYGITKLAVEKYLHVYQMLHGLSSVCLRLSNPYGERQRIDGAQGAVAVFLGSAMRDKPIEIWGDGTSVRDYVYVGDVISAILKALDYDGPERVFNIGSGEGKSLLNIIETIEAVIAKPLAVSFRPSRSIDASRNVLDISKARRELEWFPQVGFAEGIKKMANWLDEDMRGGSFAEKAVR